MQYLQYVLHCCQIALCAFQTNQIPLTKTGYFTFQNTRVGALIGLFVCIIVSLCKKLTEFKR